MPQLDVANAPSQVQLPRLSGQELAGGIGQASRQLGDTLAQTGQLIQRAGEVRARRKAVEFERELTLRTDEIAADRSLSPDEAQSRFEEARGELTDRFRRGFFDPAEFDDRARIATTGGEIRLQRALRQRAIEDSLTDTEFILEEATNNVAQADDPEGRALAFAEGVSAIRQLEQLGFLSDSRAARRIQNFGDESAAAVLRRFENEDPAAGLRFLRNEFRGSEEVRQMGIARMQNQLRATLQNESASRLEQLRIAKAERSERSFQAERTLTDEILGFGQISVSSFNQVQSDLTPQRRLFFDSIMANNGRPIATQDTGEALIRFQNMIDDGSFENPTGQQGMDFEDQLITAIANRELVPQTALNFLKSARDSVTRSAIEQMNEMKKAQVSQSARARMTTAIQEFQKRASELQRDGNLTTETAERTARELMIRAVGEERIKRGALRPLGFADRLNDQQTGFVPDFEKWRENLNQLAQDPDVREQDLIDGYRALVEAQGEP